MATWYPEATIITGNNAGTFVAGYAKKGLLHTTEGKTASGAVSAYRSANSWPHFTVGRDTSFTVYQHIAIDKAARSLQNLSGGVETNRGGAIQIEVVGFAAEAGVWPAGQVEAIKKLMRWIEAETGVKPVGPGREFASAYGQTGLRFTGADWKVFGGWCGHAHVPENCVTPDTPILKADLTWVPAGELKVGDILIGFDEFPEQVGTCAGRRYKESIVEYNGFAKKDCFKVTTTYGETVATADHPWLVRPKFDGGSRSKVQWVQTKDLKSYHKIFFVGEPWQEESSRMAGYLAGLLDADGHYQQSPSAGSWVGFGQLPGLVQNLFVSEMEDRGFSVKQFVRPAGRSLPGSKEFIDSRILGGMWETFKLLGTLRPPRLLEKINFDTVVGKTTGHVEILSVEPVGERWVSSLQTSSGTYIANGMLCHNSHWDPGAIKIETLLPIPAPPSNGIVIVKTEEVDMTVTYVNVSIPTDGTGNGWKTVPYQIDKIVSFLPQGIRPGVDGAYETNEVGFAQEDPNTVVSVVGWAPNSTAIVRLRVSGV